MSVLLDTSVIIDCLRLQDRARKFYAELPARAAVSVIAIAEIAAGTRRRREEDDAEKFWGLVTILPVTAEIAHRAGSHLRHFNASHGVEIADALIAATAEHHKLALATLNVKHFPMFAKLKRAY